MDPYEFPEYDLLRTNYDRNNVVQIFESVVYPKHLKQKPSQIEVQQLNGNF
jgi:hypothetical protein